MEQTSGYLLIDIIWEILTSLCSTFSGIRTEFYRISQISLGPFIRIKTHCAIDLDDLDRFRENEHHNGKGTFTLCPCPNQFQYPLQFPCPSHRLHWMRIPVSFRLYLMSTTASPDVKVWFCIGTCKIRTETDVRISFSRSGDRSKRNGR